MSTESSVYYDGYGSYDCPKLFLRIKPLKGVETKYSKETLIKRIWQQRKGAPDPLYTMTGMVVMIVQTISFQ